MSKNELFFKILFAVELALLPMVIFAGLFLPEWAVYLMVAGIFVCKVWVEVFKDKHNFSQKVINLIGDVAVFSVLLIYFGVQGKIQLWIAIVVACLVLAYSAFEVLLNSKVMPEIIEAVDYCYVLFKCLTLLALALAFFNVSLTNIGLFALTLSAVVSVGYKVFYCIKYKNIFRK